MLPSPASRRLRPRDRPGSALTGAFGPTVRSPQGARCTGRFVARKTLRNGPDSSAIGVTKVSAKVSFHTNLCSYCAHKVQICIRNSGAEGQDRTVDTRFFRPVLYQLSYLGDPRRSVAARHACPMARLVHGSARTIKAWPGSSTFARVALQQPTGIDYRTASPRP